MGNGFSQPSASSMIGRVSSALIVRWRRNTTAELGMGWPHAGRIVARYSAARKSHRVRFIGKRTPQAALIECHRSRKQKGKGNSVNWGTLATRSMVAVTRSRREIDSPKIRFIFLEVLPRNFE